MTIPKIKALMPMKGHSERVPGKNVRNFAGKPLFFWVLESLSNSEYISEIVINTDSDEIAKLAQDHYDVTILKRPDHLLGDMVSMPPILEHDLECISGDHFLQTHSTNPLLSTKTINESIKAFYNQDNYDSLFTVTRLQTRLFWSDGKPVNHDPGNLIRTQDLDPIYEENSCLYLFTRSVFEENNHRLGKNPMMFPMDPLESIDIDEEHDFVIAEQLKKLSFTA